MARTSKGYSNKDSNQVLKASSIDEDGTLSVNGFLAGLVGRKVALALSTTTTLNDTETYTFSESGTTLYQIKIIYTTGSRDLMLSAERIS
jgi:hypothetical protein